MNLRSLIENIKKTRSYKIIKPYVRPFKSAISHIKHYIRVKKDFFSTYRKINDVYGIFENDNKKLRIDVVIRSYHHPTSSTFIRILSPLTTGIMGNKVNIKLVDGENYKLRKGVDIVIVQRTAIPNLITAKRIVENISSRGAKLFVDTDDAFGHLNKKHPQYIEQSQRVDALDYIISEADEVWFSTEKLKRNYGIKKSKVIRNTIDDRLWEIDKQSLMNRPVPNSGEPLKIVYMGTTTHSRDFEMLMPVFHQLHRQYDGQFKLSVVGISQNIGEMNLPWLEVLQPTSALYPDFVKWLLIQGPFDVGISPLEDTDFNKGKSDIKCLDYMGMGVEPIVSSVEAYSGKDVRPHITRVDNDDESWYKALVHRIEKREELRREAPQRRLRAINYISKHRLSSKASDQVWESIERI